jgi:periplasmic protein TonB
MPFRLIFLACCTITIICLGFGTKAATATYPSSYLQIDTLPVSDSIVEAVEVEPKVDLDQWRKHLEKQLQPVVEAAAAAGMKPGQYQIDVRFLVGKDGSLSQVKPLNNPGYGLAAGAARVVRTGPKWTPGMLNGRPVRSYHTQPVIFMISK